MKKRFFIITLCSLVSIFLVSACATKKESEYITIGAVYPLTGEYSKIGIRAYNGLSMAAKEINKNGGILGKKIDLIVLDDKGEEGKVVDRYNELKEMGVSAIVGSSYSSVTNALAKESLKDNIPIITSTATSPMVTIGRPNVFRACFIDDYQSKVLSKLALDNLNAKTAVVFKNKSDEGFFKMAEIFEYEFKKEGGEIIGVEEYTDNLKDFKAMLEKYSQNKPDVIFVPDDYTIGGTVINEAFALGFKDTKFLGIDSWDSITDIIFDHDVLKNIFYTLYFSKDDPDEKIQEFIFNYYTDFSHIPLSDSAMAYDTLYILSDAISRAGSVESQNIIDSLKSTNIKVLSGQINYDKDNNPVSPNACIINFENGIRKTFAKINF